MPRSRSPGRKKTGHLSPSSRPAGLDRPAGLRRHVDGSQQPACQEILYCCIAGGPPGLWHIATGHGRRAAFCHTPVLEPVPMGTPRWWRKRPGARHGRDRFAPPGRPDDPVPLVGTAGRSSTRSSLPGVFLAMAPLPEGVLLGRLPGTRLGRHKSPAPEVRRINIPAPASSRQGSSSDDVAVK